MLYNKEIRFPWVLFLKNKWNIFNRKEKNYHDNASNILEQQTYTHTHTPPPQTHTYPTSFLFPMLSFLEHVYSLFRCQSILPKHKQNYIKVQFTLLYHMFAEWRFSIDCQLKTSVFLIARYCKCHHTQLIILIFRWNISYCYRLCINYNLYMVKNNPKQQNIAA
jgi:hypothetical protein